MGSYLYSSLILISNKIKEELYDNINLNMEACTNQGKKNIIIFIY